MSGPEVHLFHHALAHHAVQAGPVEQEGAHIYGPVAVIRRREPGAHIDHHLAVQARGNADRLGQYGLDEHPRIGHQRVAGYGSLSHSFAEESRKYLFAVQTTVTVRKDAAYLRSYGAYEHARASAPGGMFVQDVGGQGALPRSSFGEFAQVACRNAHLLGQLSHGMAVHEMS